MGFLFISSNFRIGFSLDVFNTADINFYEMDEYIEFFVNHTNANIISRNWKKASTKQGSYKMTKIIQKRQKNYQKYSNFFQYSFTHKDSADYFLIF